MTVAPKVLRHVYREKQHLFFLSCHCYTEFYRMHLFFDDIVIIPASRFLVLGENESFLFLQILHSYPYRCRHRLGRSLSVTRLTAYFNARRMRENDSRYSYFWSSSACVASKGLSLLWVDKKDERKKSRNSSLVWLKRYIGEKQEISSGRGENRTSDKRIRDISVQSMYGGKAN